MASKTQKTLQLEEMRQQKILSDVVIKCKNEQFSVHKVILAMKSPYFNTLLQESKEPIGEIDLTEEDPEVMSEILNFIYERECDFEQPPEFIVKLLILSDKFRMDNFSKICLQKLFDAVTSLRYSFIQLINLTVKLSGLLVHSIITFLLDDDNFKKIIEHCIKLPTQPWNTDCTVNNKDLYVYLITKWMSKEPGRRGPYIGTLLLPIVMNAELRILLGEYYNKNVKDLKDIFIDIKSDERIHNVKPKTDITYVTSMKLRMILYKENGGRYMVQDFDCKNNKWSLPLELPFEIGYGRKVLVKDDDIYILSVNGISMISYNLKTYRQTVTDFCSPRFFPGCHINGNFLYAIGGTYNNSYLNSVERYDIETCRWEEMAPMHQARRDPYSFSYQNNHYVVGGYIDNTRKAGLERYDNTLKQWCRIVTPLEYYKIQTLYCKQFCSELVFNLNEDKSFIYNMETNSWSSEVKTIEIDLEKSIEELKDLNVKIYDQLTYPEPNEILSDVIVDNFQMLICKNGLFYIYCNERKKVVLIKNTNTIYAEDIKQIYSCMVKDNLKRKFEV